MGSNKNNLKRSKIDSIFDTSFDEPKPFQALPPSSPKASRLITCPDCNQGYCSELMTEGVFSRYCTVCGNETRIKTDLVELDQILTPEIKSKLQEIRFKRKAND